MGKTPEHDLLAECSMASIEEVFDKFDTSYQGLKEKEIEKRQAVYGKNQLLDQKKDTIFLRLRRSFVNPFSVVLFLLAVISFITGIIYDERKTSDHMSVVIILCMLLLSGIVRFLQEMKSKSITDKLTDMIESQVSVKRDRDWKDQNSEDLVAGDIVRLKAGDRVPADIRLIRARDCFVSQSVITGESGIQEKTSEKSEWVPGSLKEYSNIVFLGSTIISGEMEGVVLSVGNQTMYGSFSSNLIDRKKGFDKGANSIAWVLIRFMVILVPVVFVASGITQDNWVTAFLFALSVAVGLTPELLPMVVTACLAKGSYNMGEKQTVVKNMNAMQGFGSMDVLCVDKTGTLTGDELILEYYMDILGNEEQQVLDYAFLNSFYSTGIRNHLDHAVVKSVFDLHKKTYYQDLIDHYYKMDEIPFDYSRKISSILVNHPDKNLLIVKGSIEDVLNKCSQVEYKGRVMEKGADALRSVHEIVDDMLEDGMKILAIAKKEIAKDTIHPDDENDLILIGYIAFFDAPKKSAMSAISKLQSLNVKVKVLTGDDTAVATSICRRLNMDADYVMTGREFENLSDNDYQIAIENTTVFAELSPRQKKEIVSVLQSNGHTVGFLGDGVNDLPAMMQTDVGISVDTASGAVKEAADVILLKKDLNVLEEGILEGRRVFVNMSKYIKITASSNLGNIIAVVIASIILPFFPMTSIQLLLLNLLYDLICLVLPWDQVDHELCTKPLEWSGNRLSRFMLSFGPISSIFDIVTFAFLMFYLCPMILGGSYEMLSAAQQTYFVALFQTGWFLESMWTQVLILYLLRTKKFPIIQSRPSKIVIVITLTGIVLFTMLVMTPVGHLIGLTKLPPVYFGFLFVVVFCYLFIVTLVKKFYVQRCQSLI